MSYRQLSQELIDFIEASPSMFHANENIRKMLEDAGFTYLPEHTLWNVVPGGKYFTSRNGSSTIAFEIPQTITDYHFQLTAAHSDSPTFKVKNNPEITSNGYTTLNVEAYGGMIDSTWLDRPLTLAGRVFVATPEGFEVKLIHIDEDLLLIPNVAIHLNRELNNGFKYNRAQDIRPLLTAKAADGTSLKEILSSKLEVQKDDIQGFDLFLVNRQKACIWGANEEFVSTPKLDDLQCAFSALKAFTAATCENHINVYCCFDNEEVGSNTKQGAMSTFLKDVLRRVNAGLGKSEDELHAALAKSFLVSCDNAHALHPSRPDFYDTDNACRINDGIVIKEAANQSYTTDATSRTIFTAICKKAEVPVQTFANRSDRSGGSTLGNLSNIQVSMHAVDMGLPQLAMHSSYETGGIKDTKFAVDALECFYNTDVLIEGAQSVRLNY